MKKRLFTSIVLLVGMFFFSSAFAVKMTSLYQAEVPVAAQTEDLKAQAIKEGFLAVLIKLSGDEQISSNPAIRQSLLKPDYYVQELNYSQSTTDSSQYLLRIRYEPSDINRLLKKAGVSYWGDTRPLILLWLLVTNRDQSSEIIGNETPNDIFATVKQQSKKYGLPLIFPVMDVADISQISPQDISNVALPVLKEAAKRYAPDAILVGTLEQGSSDFHSEWQLIVGKEQWRWEISDKSSDAVIATIMNQISQTLSKHYIVKSVSAPELWLKLEVMNITQRSDLSKLLKHLKQVSTIQQVQLLEVTSDVVELSVLVRGSYEAFLKDATLGQHLSLKYQDPREKKLVYVWVQ